MRLLIATLLCGPLAGMGIVVFIGVISTLMNAGSGSGSGGMLQAAMIAAGALYGAGIGWPAMLVFGLPAHALLYRRKSYKIGGYVLAGAILGLLSAGILGLIGLFGAQGGVMREMVMAGGMLALILLLVSVAGASVFWAIRRPDRDVIPPEKLAAAFE